MHGQIFEPSQSKLGGIDARYMVLIAYLGGAVLGLISGAQFVAWLIPLIIYLVDKDNKFIAFHAMQAFLIQIFALIIYIILAIVAVIAAVGASASAMLYNGVGVMGAAGAAMAVLAITVIVGILIFIFVIIAAIHGYKYEIYEIKFVGKQASKIVFKQ